MAVFGKNNLTGLTAGGQGGNTQCHNKAIVSLTDHLQSIHFYCGDEYDSGPYTVYAALYSHDAVNNKPQNLLDSGSASISFQQAWHWLEIPMTVNYEVQSGTIYWLSINSEEFIGWYRDNSSVQDTNIYSYTSATTAGVWTDPWTTDATHKILVALYGETGPIAGGTNPGGDINPYHTRNRQ